jgi:hypothetical protein
MGGASIHSPSIRHQSQTLSIHRSHSNHRTERQDSTASSSYVPLSRNASTSSSIMYNMRNDNTRVNHSITCNPSLDGLVPATSPRSNSVSSLGSEYSTHDGSGSYHSHYLSRSPSNASYDADYNFIHSDTVVDPSMTGNPSLDGLVPARTPTLNQYSREGWVTAEKHEQLSHAQNTEGKSKFIEQIDDDSKIDNASNHEEIPLSDQQRADAKPSSYAGISPFQSMKAKFYDVFKMHNSKSIELCDKAPQYQINENITHSPNNHKTRTFFVKILGSMINRHGDASEYVSNRMEAKAQKKAQKQQNKEIKQERRNSNIDKYSNY